MNVQSCLFFFIHCGDDLYHARTLAIVGTRNSSLEGAMKLKFAPFSPLEMPFPMISCFAKVIIFRFWPKTMDYNKAFWPKSMSCFVVILLLTGRCYGAEICAILLLLRCPFR